MALDFYAAVMGWTYRQVQLGESYHIAFSGSAPVAGIGALRRAARVSTAWTPYFAVVDADETAARIRERGATVAVGPLKLDSGRGALAADRDGAVFGIWQGALVENWETWRDTAPAWTRLHARNAFDAAIFYGEVFDWAGDRPGCCDVRYEGEEVLLLHAHRVVARITSGALEAAPDPALRPHWHTCFTVADTRAHAARAVAHGGTVLDEGSNGRQDWIRLADPDGVAFTLTRPY
ncbi:VOC family protein [Streptomyces xanthochromogenes]|uniref:VOC family protein n=1 Tax=Streptomyces xanthochromogenes TaxID=67384 RepID=UPI00381B9771